MADLTLLANLSPIVLIIIGIISSTWFISNVLRVSPGFIDDTVDALSIISMHVGWIFGALGLVTAAVIFTTEESYSEQQWFTVTLLIIVGYGLFMEPLKNLPWVALLGLTAGGGLAALIYFRYGERATGTILRIDWKHILGTIMILVFLLVFFALKFIEDATRATTMILQFQPVVTFLGLLCILQGILIALDHPLIFEMLRKNKEEIFIIGTQTSSIYALLALGFTLIFGVARLFNMAHTALYMMAAYFIYTFTKLQGLGTLTAVSLAVVLTTLLAMGIYRGFIHRVREHELTVLILTVAVALIIQESIKLWISGEYLGVDSFVSGFIEVFDVRILWQDVFIIMATLILVVVLWTVITRTGLGIAIRATAQDPEVANLMGINTGQIYLISMGLAGLLAALAGALIAPRYVLVPLMWTHPLILCLSIIVLGGLGNLKGSIIAAFILGYAETCVVFLYPTGSFLKGAVALTAMITILIIRPEGLFGVSFEEERL